MKNFLKIILTLTIAASSSLSLAANRDPMISVFIDNQSSQVVHLGTTRYNVADFKLTKTEVLPNSGLVEVGSVIPTNAKATLSFFVHVTNDPMTFYNTPIISYSVDRGIDPDWIDSFPLSVPGRTYNVFASQSLIHSPDRELIIKLTDNPSPAKR